MNVLILTLYVRCVYYVSIELAKLADLLLAARTSELRSQANLLDDDDDDDIKEEGACRFTIPSLLLYYRFRIKIFINKEKQILFR